MVELQAAEMKNMNTLRQQWKGMQGDDFNGLCVLRLIGDEME